MEEAVSLDLYEFEPTYCLVWVWREPVLRRSVEVFTRLGFALTVLTYSSGHVLERLEGVLPQDTRGCSQMPSVLRRPWAARPMFTRKFNRCVQSSPRIVPRV